MKLFHSWFHARELSQAQAATTLRVLFAATFVTQFVLAGTVAVLLRLAVPGIPTPNPILGWALVILAIVHMSIAPVVLYANRERSDRHTHLYNMIFVSVMLSGTAWFAAFGLATNQQGWPLYLLFFIVSSAYVAGFLFTTIIGRAAAESPRREDVLAEEELDRELERQAELEALDSGESVTE